MNGFLEKYWLDLAVLAVGLLSSIVLYLRYRKTRYVNFLTYIPSIWTSLGILGTFISIYLSLAELKFESVEHIERLVYMIAPAFSTSIIGIAGAMISSVLVRIIRSSVDVREEKKYLEIIENIGANVHNMGRGTRVLAREMGREVGRNIDEGLRQTLVEHVKAMEKMIEREEKAFEKMSGEIKKEFKDVANENKTALEQICNQYRDEAAEIKKKSVEYLEKIREEHEKQIEELTEKEVAGFEKTDREIKTSIENAYKDLAEKITAASNNLSSVSASLNDVSTELGKTNESIKPLSESFSKMKADIEMSVASLTAIFDKDAKNAEEVKSLLEDARKVIASLNSSLKQLKTPAKTENSKVIVISSGGETGSGKDKPKRSRVADWFVRIFKKKN